MITKALLPAAGLGTRFLPATKASPKEILPIVDKPMIQYSIEEAVRCDIKDFIVITGKNKRPMEDHLDTAPELEDILKKKNKLELLNSINTTKDCNFAFIRQGRPLGLGHAILCAKQFLKYEPFAVMLSDDVIDPRDNLLEKMISLYSVYKSPIIALEEVPLQHISRYGVVEIQKKDNDICQVTGLIEKPKPEESPSNLAIIGRYILTPEIFDAIQKVPLGIGGEYQLTDALNYLLKKQTVYGLVFRGKRYDAGDKLGFLKATIDLALRRPEFSLELKKHLKLIFPEISIEDEEKNHEQ